MGLTETSVALAGCVLVLVVAITLDRRPYRPGKLNYIPLMIIALAAILVLGRHLLAFFLSRHSNSLGPSHKEVGPLGGTEPPQLRSRRAGFSACRQARSTSTRSGCSSILAKAHPVVPGWSICTIRVPCAGDLRRARGGTGWLGRDR